MQIQSPLASRAAGRLSRAAAPAPSVDGLIAERRAVADAFDLLHDELAHPSPDRGVCVELLMKIDALLAPPARAGTTTALVSVGDPAALAGRLAALADAERAWRAKAEVLIELVELRVFDAPLGGDRADGGDGHHQPPEPLAPPAPPAPLAPLAPAY